jgi:hypothetical protein
MSCCTKKSADPCDPRAPQSWMIRQGTRFKARLRVKRDNGSAFNLTGYQVRAEFRWNHHESLSGPVATAVCTVAPDGRWVDVVLGALTTKLMVDGGVFDVEVFNPNDLNEVYRVVQGTWSVNPEATKA